MSLRGGLVHGWAIVSIFCAGMCFGICYRQDTPDAPRMTFKVAVALVATWPFYFAHFVVDALLPFKRRPR